MTPSVVLVPVRPLVMGILNVTPDSFSDGGRFVDHGARGRNQDEIDAIIGAWAAERQPADIIDTLSAAELAALTEEGVL